MWPVLLFFLKYIYIYMCVCVFIHILYYIHNIYIYIYMFVCVCVCVCLYIFFIIFIIYTYIYIYIYICLCMCLYVCLYGCMCTYITSISTWSFKANKFYPKESMLHFDYYSKKNSFIYFFCILNKKSMKRKLFHWTWNFEQKEEDEENRAKVADTLV